jgi:hypothetical protein
MHMGWFVVISEDDDAQTMRPVNCDHS